MLLRAHLRVRAGLRVPPRVPVPQELSQEVRRARLAAHVATERGALVGRLRRLGLSPADADDALSEATTDGLRDVGQLRELDRLPAWFARLVRRAGLRALRAGRREIPVAEPPEATTSAEGPERSGCACAPRLLEALPAVTRLLVQRVDVEDAPVGDVARGLGLTPNAASVRLFRARQRLRDDMLACCGARSVAEANATCACDEPRPCAAG